MAITRYCMQCGHALQAQHVDQVERLVCSEADCGYVHWDNPVPVAAGLIVYNNALLLARNRQWPAGLFSLITGYIERHETPEETMRRELHEELGLAADSVRFIGHYLFKQKNQLLIAYALEAHGEPKLSDEIAEIRTVPLSDIAHYDFSPFTLTQTIVHDWVPGVTHDRS